MRPTLFLAFLSLLGACASAPVLPEQRAEYQPPQSGRQTATKDVLAQALLGAAFYDELEFERESGTDRVEADLSQLPILGIAGQKPFVKGRLEFGFEGGLVVGWRRDEAKVISTGTGSVLVLVDNELWLTDLFAGLYLSSHLGPLRPYVGAGPLMMYGDLDSDTELGDRSESDFGVGVYGRAGVEFDLGDGSWLGVGGRYLETDVEFNDGGRSIDVNGWQAMLTFSKYF